jgi:hypothetical protein
MEEATLLTISRANVCLLMLSCLFVGSVMQAQTVSTQILGQVTDATGAVIPGAEVTAKKTETGDVRTVTTNETGNYIFPLLDIGTYEVSCTFEGFKTEIRRDIVLQLQDKARVNFQLEVGQQVEIVEVTGQQPLLKTEDATLGSVVEQKSIEELPVNGRNFAQLATLMPGVTFGVSRMGTDGQGTIGVRAMPGQMTGLAGPGQRDINQNITLDGAVAVDAHKNSMMFIPSLEAVQEFKVQSAVYSAEFGMNSGMQANVAVKSGTNELHGTLFEFMRNNKLDARNYFLTPGAEKPHLRKHQFGAVVSGPLVRDRTFWLASFEGRRERRASAAQGTVPTVAMRAGDFSEFLTPGNRWYPNDTNPAQMRSIRLPGSADPFPNNMIPRNLINPVSNNLLTWTDSPLPEGGFMRLPNFDDAARASGNTINLIGTSDQILDSDQFLTRIDHRLSDNDRIFGRYLLVESDWARTPLTLATQDTHDYRGQNLAFGWTKLLSPTVLNEFRFGWMRFNALSSAYQTDTGFSQRDLGLDFRVVGDGNRTLTEFEEGLPNISIVGYSGMGSGSISLGLSSVYEFSDNFSVSKGKHNFKFGGLYQYSQVDFGGSNTQRGSMGFTRDIQGIPDGFAAFLLGYPLTTQSAEGFPLGFMRQHKAGFYWLDDYKATQKLTINFGLRWDIFGVVDDADGRIRSLSWEDGIAPVIGGNKVPILYPDPNVREGLYAVPYTQIMPRLGIAYRITDTLVLRAGAGHFYAPLQTNTFSILSLNPPFSGSVVFQNDNANPTITIDNPFAGSERARGPAALIALGSLEASDGNRSHFRGNDVWQWNLELEKSLGRDMVVGMAYLGSAASNLDIPISNANNPDPGPGSVQGRRPTQFYVDSRDPSALLPLSTVRLLESAASTNYNALQMRAEKRYANGLSFNASYNFQKHMGLGYSVNEGGTGFGARNPQDPRNWGPDYGRYNTDQRHRFVFSHVWEIPWLRNAGGVKGAVLGGWAVNGIIQMGSGLPVTLSQSGDSLNTGAGGVTRPHVAPGAVVDRVWANRTVQQWFDTSAYVRSKYEGSPAAGLYLGPKGYGNAGVSLFDAPGNKTWDFALFKEFRVTEGHRIQFRWEAFNFLNTPQFNVPQRQLGNANFGRITSTRLSNREMQFGLKYRF